MSMFCMMTLMGQQRLEVHHSIERIFCNLTKVTFSNEKESLSFFYFLPTFHLLYSVSRIQQTMQVVITGRERHCYAKEKGEEVV